MGRRQGPRSALFRLSSGIDQLANAHLVAGGGLTFISLTFAHGMSDSLESSLDT